MARWIPTPPTMIPSRPRNGGRAKRRARERSADRAHYLIERLIDVGARTAPTCRSRRTPTTSTRCRTICSRSFPGDPNIEEKIRNYARWNAMAMVVRANKHRTRRPHRELCSAATLYDVGYNHSAHRFGATRGRPGSCRATRNGVYARAFMLGGSPRSSSTTTARSRRQGHLVVSAPVVDAGFRQFPTVSMGRDLHGDLPGAIQKYLQDRGSRTPTGARCGRSWATARWTSPSPPARSAWPAARSSTIDLRHHCNLQRLDGPVRGNGKIIQSSRASFAAPAGTSQVVWGTSGTSLAATRAACSTSG